MEATMAIEKDPVCGMDVDTETSELSVEYEGKTYWFCGRGCMLDFQEDPERYLDPGYEPSM
jgi:P-type Cu+ transporter